MKNRCFFSVSSLNEKVRFFDSFYTMMLTHKEVIIKYFLRIWHKFVICIKIQFVFLL